MAFGRFVSRTQAQPVAGINVTPLVDVMLVLVVIFILAAPILAATLRVQLPQAEGVKAAPPAQTPSLALELDAQGALHIGTEAVDEAAVRQRLAALAAQDPQAELQLKADTAVPYGRVVQVMGWAHAAGLGRIGFVAQPVPAAAP
ncbi:biopolymer transporter ExbD [Comamonas sp. CMM03]|uniref:ExbD/TolR family protein n=1 Tax=Comamonas TaxID=283 RepID=UPI001C456BAC|nr:MULTISPECIES: biopolymer transporter ExbD [Comamonas]MBV7418956.1 biopolymer transporter ExbD [Comamonas sp. CMM03]MDH1292552.1 biopolymer transporter ExbD [Comamonas terrigena]